MSERCNTFWGSHGCDLPKGHDGQHVCDCHDPNDADDVAAHRSASPEDYGADGCAGTWPYYGRACMTGDGGLKFFRNAGIGFVDMPEEFDRLDALREGSPA